MVRNVNFFNGFHWHFTVNCYPIIPGTSLLTDPRINYINTKQRLLMELALTRLKQIINTCSLSISSEEGCAIIMGSFTDVWWESYCRCEVNTRPAVNMCNRMYPLMGLPTLDMQRICFPYSCLKVRFQLNAIDSKNIVNAQLKQSLVFLTKYNVIAPLTLSHGAK